MEMWKNIPILMVLVTTCWVHTHGQAASSFEEFYVREELPIGTIICNLITEAGLDQDYDKATLDKLRFQFLTQPNLDKEYFSINEQSGIIRTTNILDRDTLCPQKDECIIKFDIAIQPNEYFQIVKIQVIVFDINDNAPKFPQKLLSLDISESAVPGTSFVIPAASDPDSGINGIQEYELVPITGKFRLQDRNTADGATDLRLVLRERLDRETMDHDKVYIMAYDGADPPLTGSIAVDISVIDANDNDPKFENSTYEVTVMENLPIGTTILRVNARDQDAGNNGRIAYQFSKHTQQESGKIFGINSESGEIFVKGSLDYEKGFIHLLSLIAHDKGPDSLPSHATAIVRVEDVNDNAPTISVNTLTKNGVAQVLENSPLDTFVAHISVLDNDSDKNRKFSCSIDNSHFTLQKLYLAEYKLVSASMFDRESRDEYTVSLVCKDKGTNPQISIAEIKVQILDANDHMPVFAENAYHVTIKENNQVGMSIAQVNATDKDSGQNGHILYRLEPMARDKLSIDPDTGLITAQIIFDYEETHSMEFDVIAEDRGDPIQAARVQLQIAILDLDDERPTFSQDTYSFAVHENHASDTQVGQVKAVDRDSEPFDQFRFYLDPNSVSSDLFRIDAREGVIYTTKPLDREAQQTHYIIAVVTPLDDPTYSSTASVTVYIADKNDNPPVFDFPTPYNYTVEVSGKAPKGYMVTRLRAHDKDARTNAHLTYSVTEGNDDNSFIVDALSGAISINIEPSEVPDKQEYHLKVTVRDGGEPPLSDSADLTIVVNKNLPFSLRSSTNFLSEENLTIVLAFALATIFVAIIIIIAIVIIIRRSKNVRQAAEGQPKEKQHMLAPVPGEEPPNQTLSNNCKPVTNNYVSIDEIDHRAKKPVNHHNNHVNNHYGATVGHRREPPEFQRLTKEPCETPWEEGDATQTHIVTPSRSRSLQGPICTVSPRATRSCHNVNLRASWQSLADRTETRDPEATVKVTCPVSRERDMESLSVGSASNSDSGRGHSSEGEADGHRHGNKVTDPDQIKTLVHQLHLKKQQLKDLSSKPLPTRVVVVNGTRPRAAKQSNHTSKVQSNSLHPSDCTVAARCKASSPVSRETNGSGTYPAGGLVPAHGSYTLPTRGRQALYQREHLDKNAVPLVAPSSDMNGYHQHHHRYGHSRSHSRTSLDYSDLDLIGSQHNIYEPVNNIR